MKTSLRVDTESARERTEANFKVDEKADPYALFTNRKSESALVYLSGLFFEDAACTKFAAQETYAMNTCLPASTARYVYNSYTTTPTGFNIVTQYYSDSTCTTPDGNAGVDTATSACGTNKNQFSYAIILNAPPSAYPADGTILNMYATQANCQNEDSTVLISVFLVYGGNTCVPGYNTNFIAANDYSGVYVGTSNTNCLQSGPFAGISCSATPVYSTAYDYFGYTTYVEYIATPSSPTRSPTVAPSVVLTPAPLAYLSGSYFADAACTKFAAQETFALNVCLPAGTTRHVYTSYTITPSGYNVVSQFYSDATCSVPFGQPSVYTPTAACGNNGDTYSFATILTTPPTAFAADGTLLTMYTSNSNCVNKASLVMSSIFLVYEGDTCVPGFNGNFMAANDYSGVYIGSTNTNCLQSALSQGGSCPVYPVYTSAFDYYGYPDYIQYSVATGSKGMDTSTTIAVAVVVPVVVLVLLAAGAMYWFSAKKAPLLQATEKSNDA